MMIPANHNSLLGSSFEITCSKEIFTSAEIEMLERFGAWMLGLATGDIEPFTDAQKRFVACANEKAQPESDFEIAFSKYLLRCKLEAENALQRQYRVSDESEDWFPRSEHWRKG